MTAKIEEEWPEEEPTVIVTLKEAEAILQMIGNRAAYADVNAALSFENKVRKVQEWWRKKKLGLDQNKTNP